MSFFEALRRDTYYQIEIGTRYHIARDKRWTLCGIHSKYMNIGTLISEMSLQILDKRCKSCLIVKKRVTR